MRVVLFQSVSNLGLAGEIVDVKPGYFRNFLEPRSLALRETPGALRILASKKRKIEQVLLKEKSQAEDARKAISSIVLSFKLKAGEKGRLFGSVTNKDISEALAAKGVEVDRHKIELPEAIKSIGRHTARIRLHPEVIAEVGILVDKEVAAAEIEAEKAAAAAPAAEAPAAEAAPPASAETTPEAPAPAESA